MKFDLVKRVIFIGSLVTVISLNGMTAMSAAAPKLDNPAIELEKSFIGVVKTLKPTVVDISAEKTVTRMKQMEDPMGGMFNDPMFRDFFRQFSPQQPQREKLQSRGSGFIIRKDGYVLTNNHVVKDVDKVTVTLSDGRVKEAKIIGTDENTDLAVLKIEGDNFPVVELGDSDHLEIGVIVFAFGSPFSFSGSVSQGIVSGLARELGLSQYENLIQTDAAMNPGNSGGPLVNLQGQVIGINKAIATQGVAQSAGLGFAIPINLARKVMGDIIETGKWKRGYLGIYMDELTEEKAKQFNLTANKGILISKVIEGSPAAKAGLKEYDVITQMDGKATDSPRELQSMVAMTKVGQVVVFSVIRDGKAQTVKVTITERSDESLAEGADMSKKWGMTVKPLTEEILKQKGLDKNLTGVIVTDIDPNAEAYDSGFRLNDIILEIDRKPVKDIKDFSTILSGKKAKDKVLFRVQLAAGGYKIVIFEVPEDKSK